MAKAHGSHPAGAMVESAVRVGYRPPQTLLEPGRFAELRHVLKRAEEIGVDHLCTGDHVSFHGGTGFDGLVQATAFTMLTERLPVHTSVYQLSLRHPVLVARQLASLAQLAPGRLVFGVGIGGEDRAEAAAVGIVSRVLGDGAEVHQVASVGQGDRGLPDAPERARRHAPMLAEARPATL